MKKTSLWLVIFCNAIFLLYSLHYFLHFSNFTLSLLINLLIFIVPGIGWIGILKKRVKNSVMLLFFIVCFSLIILMTGLVGHHTFSIESSSLTFLIYLCIITNLGIFLSRNSDTLQFFIGKKKEFLVLILCSFLIYGCMYYGAREIPPLVDLDLEIPGPAYGLIYELKPYLTTNMNEYLNFSHPPLANFYCAYGILFLDKMEKFKFYYDSAKQAEKILKSKPNEESTHEITLSIFENDKKLFLQRNLLFEVRLANIFISVLIFASLFLLILRITNSKLLGIFAGSLYIFSPGIFVRSCSFNYVAVTNYGLFILVYCYIFFDNNRISWSRNLIILLPGVFAAFANQKTLFIIGAIVLLNAIIYIKKKEEKDMRNIIVNPSIIGYTLGMVLFWIYGLLIDSQSFIHTHIKTHIFNRIFHIGSMPVKYLSILRLWMEFLVEAPVFILAVLALVFVWKKYINRKEGIFILWFLVGAISFSIVDWRQTRHLMLLVPALIVLSMMAIAQVNKWLKRGFILLLVVALSYSLWFNIQLLNDFTFYKPTPSFW